jgi:hypothetical protein
METFWRLNILGFLVRQQLQQPSVLNLVLRHSVLALGYQSSVILKCLLMDKLLHCDLHGTNAHARWFRSVSFSALAAFDLARYIHRY